MLVTLKTQKYIIKWLSALQIIKGYAAYILGNIIDIWRWIRSVLLNIHSTRFIYCYVISKDHSDSERENLLPWLHGQLFLISNKGSFICTISQTNVDHWLEWEIGIDQTIHFML